MRSQNQLLNLTDNEAFAETHWKRAEPLLSVCEERRSRSRGHVAADDAERYDEARVAFGAPRYQALYQCWLKHGDAVLEVISSTAVADAIRSGARGARSLGSHLSERQTNH